MGRASSGAKPSPRFTPSEMEQMEKLFLEAKGVPLDQHFYQGIAEKINLSSGRSRKRVLQWKQVQRWIQDRQKNSRMKTTSLPIVSKNLFPVPDAYLSSNAHGNNSEMIKGEDASQVMEFEARSSDGAWYDVASFLSHRNKKSGELEVLVRYRDFGAEEDEWVNLKKAVRERSVPIDHDECHRIAVGSLVVCFRENDDEASYYDAHVVEIQRKQHDIRGCRCHFLIKYDHDETQETVRLGRLCRRP